MERIHRRNHEVKNAEDRKTHTHSKSDHSATCKTTLHPITVQHPPQTSALSQVDSLIRSIQASRIPNTHLAPHAPTPSSFCTNLRLPNSQLVIYACFGRFPSWLKNFAPSSTRTTPAVSGRFPNKGRVPSMSPHGSPRSAVL